MNEKKIWDFLMKEIGNPYGVAGLMGNLYAESALNPTNLQNTYEKKLGMTDAEYTAAVDAGRYDNFVHDSAGYGLAQWTYWSRKQNLLAFAKERGASIGDLDAQLAFLVKELNAYSAVMKVLKAAKTVKEASDKVLVSYEKPKNQSDSNKEKRAGYGQKYYDAHVNTTPAEEPQEEPTTEGSEKAMFTNLQFAEFCLKVYAAKWVYWYGTCGYKCTTSLFNSKKNQYPSHYTAARESGYRKDISEGKMCADCVGLIKSFFWLNGNINGTKKYGANNCPDKSANGMFKLCVKTGPIKTIPDVPGLVVWKDGHIGVYVGDGYTVEMMGFNYDCVKKKVTDGKWTNWGQLPASMLQYVGGEVTGVTLKLGDRTLEKGDKGEDVAELQEILVKMGYNLGTYGAKKDGVDGDFGKKTLEAVTDFQNKNGLTADGKVGPATVKALTNGTPADTTIQPTPTEPEPGKPMVVVTASSVNVRTGNGTNYKKLGAIPNGTALEWVATAANGWLAVVYEKQVAWVSGQYAAVRG